MEIGGQQQENHHHRQQKAGSETLQHLLHRHDLSAHCHAYPRRRGAEFLDRAPHLLRDTTQIRAADVGGDRYHALHVVAFVLTDGGALGDVCNVAEQNRLAVAVSDRNVFRLFNRVHIVLWNLHLDLVGDTTVWVGPVVGHDKAAGRGGRDERAREVFHRQPAAARAGQLAIQLHGDRGVIERLAELQVAECGNFFELILVR